MQRAVDGVRTFLGEVVGESKRCTWPERRELIESTIVVIVSVLILSIFVGLSDKLLVTLIRLLIPAG